MPFNHRNLFAFFLKVLSKNFPCRSNTETIIAKYLFSVNYQGKGKFPIDITLQRVRL